VVLIAAVVVLAQETFAVERGGQLAVGVRTDFAVWEGKRVEACRQGV
jgi:hypothetical protein